MIQWIRSRWASLRRRLAALRYRRRAERDVPLEAGRRAIRQLRRDAERRRLGSRWVPRDRD